MCSRFENKAGRDDLRRRFGDLPWPDSLPSNELRPTDQVLAVDGGDHVRLLAWGIPAPWDGRPLINARAETLSAKATFRPLLGNRCLVPATAYLEWRADGSEHRLRNRIGLADGGLFAMAGLTDGTFVTIVTCAPSPAIAHIHDRMPVILARDAEVPWRDPSLPFDAVRGLLAPLPGELLAWREDRPPEERQMRLF